MSDKEKPALSGRSQGFQSGATMSCAQVAAELKRYNEEFPGTDQDDLMAGVLAVTLGQMSKQLADYILGEAESSAEKCVQLMRQIRARGVRIELTIKPLAPGEGEMDNVVPIPLSNHLDVEVIEAPLGTNEACGVLGCDRRATYCVRSLAANSGCWACTLHAAEINSAIRRKAGE